MSKHLYHKFASAKADSADSSLVRPSNWNARLDYSNVADTGPSGTDAVVREVLTANRTYYVRTDGSNSNTGLVDSAGGAFLTIPFAITTVSQLDLGGFTVTIQVRSGTYTDPVVLANVVGSPGANSIILVGDTSTPSNVVLNVANDYTIFNPGTQDWIIKGFKLTNTGGAGALFGANDGSNWRFGNIEFGATTYYTAIEIGLGSFSCFDPITISDTYYAWLSMSTGNFQIATTVTLSTAASWGGSFCYIDRGGVAQFQSTTFSGSSTTTGQRYDVSTNGVIWTQGGGANFLPGDVAGVAATGGQYG